MRNIGFVVVVCLLNSGCVFAGFPKAKITYRVVDQEGLPIEGAHVDVGFIEASSRSVVGVTDTSGVFVAEDICSGGAGSLIKKNGYHWSGGGCVYTNINKMLNRFEPWNPTVEVVLKEVRNPTSMAHLIGRDNIRIPTYDKPIGFDLEKGDWVAPYGAGKQADFNFTARKIANVILGVTLELSFSNEHDGIMEYPFDPEDRSWFKWPYEAPLSGYTNNWSRYRKSFEYETDYAKLYPNDAYFKDMPVHRGIKQESDLKDDEDINYIFRVRSVVDESGNVVKACYGKIQGEIKIEGETIHLSYWFNPHWTRNLEDDPEKNIRLD